MSLILSISWALIIGDKLIPQAPPINPRFNTAMISCGRGQKLCKFGCPGREGCYCDKAGECGSTACKRADLKSCTVCQCETPQQCGSVSCAACQPGCYATSPRVQTVQRYETAVWQSPCANGQCGINTTRRGIFRRW